MQVRVLSNDVYLTLGLQNIYKEMDLKNETFHFIDVDRGGGLKDIYDYLNSPSVKEKDKIVTLTRDGIRSRQFKNLGYLSIASSLDEMKNIGLIVHSSSTPERWRKQILFYMNADFLTPRQEDIIRLYECGMQTSEISLRLGISVKTLYAHMEKAFTQYNAKSLAEFIFYKNNYTLLNKVA